MRRSPNLRVGVLSDVHISKDSEATHFVNALRHFDGISVDAVLIAGDLTRWGRPDEFAVVEKAWRTVFPKDHRSDGGLVVKLFVTGNHDVDGFAYPGSGYASAKEARPHAFYYNRSEMWRRYFGECYSPVVIKEVKGYVFVLRNWISKLGSDEFPGKWAGFEDEVSPLPSVMRLFNPLENRPFFYVQHEPMADTVNASWLVGGKRWDNQQDSGESQTAMRRYLPNCFALTGHTHLSLTDEQSIWQGDFTAVNCSCIAGWEFTPPGRENGFSIPDFGKTPPLEMPAIDFQAVRQGLVMDVYDDAIRLERRDFLNDCKLGDDWVVPLFDGRTVPVSNSPKYDFRRRAEVSPPPQFAKGAKVALRRVLDGRRRSADGIRTEETPCRQVYVEFPDIVTFGGTSPVRSYDYIVRIEGRQTQICEKRVFSPGVLQPERSGSGTCVCAFPDDIVQSGTEVVAHVVPCDCWGNKGNEISSDWSLL